MTREIATMMARRFLDQNNFAFGEDQVEALAQLLMDVHETARGNAIVFRPQGRKWPSPVPIGGFGPKPTL